MRRRGRRRPDRVPPALSEGPARDRSRQCSGRTRRLEAAAGAAGTGSRRRHRARARLCLCALCPQQVSRLWRGVVGLDRRRRGQQGDRRCQRDARGGGRIRDDQSGRRAPPDPRQRHPVDQPRADGRGFVRPPCGNGARMGRLPDHQVSRRAQNRRADAAKAGPAAARRRRIRVGAERAAAIANAIYDATGVRFRELPFTPERILAGLRGEHAAAPTPAPLAAPQPAAATDRWKNPFAGRRGAFATAAALCVAVAWIRRRRLAVASDRADRAARCLVFSAATIARGPQLASLGDCAVCHT